MSIQMRSTRGAVGSTWLARSVLARIEETLGTRGRAAGKRLARAGAVTWIDVSEGRVRSSVSVPGADASSALAEPELSLGPWRSHDIAAFTDLVAEDPSTVIALLAGDYDETGEQAMTRAGLPLLPGELAQVSYGCTCLAWPAVCEHVYALVYVLTEHIDAAPADYLQLLGIDVERIRLAPAGSAPPAGPAGAAGPAGPGGPAGSADVMGDGGGAGGVGRETDSGGDSGPEAGREADPDADPNPSAPFTTRFAPARVDAAILHDMMSDDAAAVFAAFYAGASEAAAPEGATPEVELDDAETHTRDEETS